MHVNYAFQYKEPVINVAHPSEGAHPPMNLSFSGPIATSAATTFSTGGEAAVSTVTISLQYGSGLYLNNTLGCTECCAGSGATFEALVGGAWVNCSKVTLREGEAVCEAPGQALAVRYAHANYPQCALYNSDGLPAGPFVLNTTQPASAAVNGGAAGGDAAPWLNAPPMGLNSWNSLHCNVDERKARGMADALVKLGLREAGWTYVNMDDCWQVERSPNGTITADPARFPGGIRSLTDYVHGLGLKFGLYTAAHQYTCQKRPGSYQHELQDAQTYWYAPVAARRIMRPVGCRLLTGSLQRCFGSFHPRHPRLLPRSVSSPRAPLTGFVAFTPQRLGHRLSQGGCVHGRPLAHG